MCVPYRIDISAPPTDTLDVLVELGALDVEVVGDRVAAILPDSVSGNVVAERLGGARVEISDAVGRDEGSVWLVSPRAVRIGSVRIALAERGGAADALLLKDSAAFGTGHHPTTALCIEALEEALAVEPVERMLDVGTGSGILALVALHKGVREVVGVDIDKAALEAAAENARLNGMEQRLRLVGGGPEAVTGTWPLVVANVLAAPLVEMAPVLVRRLASRGRLILSGIPASGVENEVRDAYRHAGLRHLETSRRGGWAAQMFQTSW